VLGVLYFFSGAVALAYEISWNRQIGLLFGHSEQAAAVVLGAYFVGLGLGYYLGGLLSRRSNPLRDYGLAELLAAGWTLTIPRLLDVVEDPALIGWLSYSSPAAQTISRTGFCFTLLLPATVALGATFPLIAESLRGSTKDISNWSAVSYGLNTLGACLGIAATTFFLLLRAGVTGSSDLAAIVGASIGVAAIVLSRHRSPDPSQRASNSADQDRRIPLHIWIVALLGGLGTLALEVLYTRLFSLVFHNSSYTFGEIIASFLLALGLAAILVPLFCRRLAPGTLLISSAWLGSVLISVSVILFIRRTGLEYFPLARDFRTYLLHSFRLTLTVVFPPVLCLGMLLPALWKSLKVEQLSGSVLGRITMFNSMAAALGAILASFLLLPNLGLWRSFSLISLLFLGLSCFLLVVRRKWKTGAAVFASGLLPLLIVWSGNDQWIQQRSTDEVVLKRWETAYGWIDVIQDTSSKSLKIRQNLHYRHGSTGSNETRERRQALLPLLLHDKPRTVLHLGLGTGITAAGALEHPDVEEIAIVELIPEVVEAARMLGESNSDVLDDPRVTVRVDDARHFLLATDQTFDVIVSDLFVPWESQTGYLYTVEHFQTAKSRLRKGGIYCQWLALYQLGPEEFEMIANSFASVFPDNTIWWGLLSRSKPMVALIGTASPLSLNEEKLARRIGRISAASDLNDSYLSRPDRVLELAVGRWPFRQDAALNTDEHPRVEFLTPLSHLDRRLMSRDRLKDYFDRVFDTLPPALKGMSTEEQRRSRNAQRVILFPE
jgi:spermidine synthase